MVPYWEVMCLLPDSPLRPFTWGSVGEGQGCEGEGAGGDVLGLRDWFRLGRADVPFCREQKTVVLSRFKRRVWSA